MHRYSAAPGTGSVGNYLGKRRFNRTLLVVLLVVIVGGASIISLFAIQATTVSTKPFAFDQQVTDSPDGDLPSLKAVNINGAINIISWSRPDIVINGTITAKGLGASANDVTIYESNGRAFTNLEVWFPTGTSFGAAYGAEVNLYVPPSIHNITVTTTNGVVTARFPSPIMNGTYHFTTTNGSISLMMPAGSSCRIDATTTIGSVETMGMSFNNMMGQTRTHVSGMVGTGTAVMILTTTIGSISITGT